MFDRFNVPGTPADDTKTAETVKDFCDRGYKLIDALQAGVLIGNPVYGALKTSFAELAKRNLSPADWEATEQARKAFDATQAQEADSILRAANANELKEYYEIERQFATSLFSSLAMCVRIPGADRQNLDRFERWASEGAKAKADLNTLKANIETLKNSPPELPALEGFVKFILDNLWSFILVVALSLKFAKGINQVRR